MLAGSFLSGFSKTTKAMTTSTMQFSRRSPRPLHRTQAPCLRASVPPCEPLLLMALCSKTSTTLFLTRSHGDTEAVALHRTPSHDGAHDHCTEPKLRVSVAPCEPLLLMVLCSKTSTTPFLTRRHGDTEAVALHRTPSHDGAHDHCTEPCSLWLCALCETGIA